MRTGLATNGSRGELAFAEENISSVGKRVERKTDDHDDGRQGEHR